MTLNDVCELIVDCPHTTAPDECKGYPLIRTPNIGRGRLLLDGVHRVSERVYRERVQRAIPQDGDLIFAREAPAGNVALIVNGQKVCLGQRTVLIRPDQSLVDPAYLTYYLLSPQKQHDLLGTANGATVAHVNLPIIRKLPVSLPELDVQKRVSSILTAYDNLIENNQRQIMLLEEAAQRLYKEWFVDFRFPGYEYTQIVDGVPEGWKKEYLTDLVDVQYGYAFDGALFTTTHNGMPIIRIRNIPSGQTADYTTEEAQDQYIVHNGDIVVGMDGEFHINTWGGNDSYLVQRTCSFRPKNENMKGYILQAIVEPIKFFEKTVVGATVAHLGKKHIDTIKIFSCPDEMYRPFNAFLKKRQLLMNQNVSLIEARDRLLPKLMSGEIEV